MAHMGDQRDVTSFPSLFGVCVGVGVCARARARPDEPDGVPAVPSIARSRRGPAAPPPAQPGPVLGPLARRPAWSCQP